MRADEIIRRAVAAQSAHSMTSCAPAIDDPSEPSLDWIHNIVSRVGVTRPVPRAGILSMVDG
jgi:hypothetical protein